MKYHPKCRTMVYIKMLWYHNLIIGAFHSVWLCFDYQVCWNIFLKNPQSTPQAMNTQLTGWVDFITRANMH